MHAHHTKHKISDKSAGFSLFSVQPEIILEYVLIKRYTLYEYYDNNNGNTSRY